jgi:hypothetical protein
MLEHIVGAGCPRWARDWSESQVDGDLVDGATDAPVFAEVFHALRSVTLGSRSLAQRVLQARERTPIVGPRSERDLEEWISAVCATAHAFVSDGVESAGSQLLEQLKLFDRIGRTYQDSLYEWIAHLPEHHGQLSVDWAAATICRLEPRLLDYVSPASPFLPTELVE